MRMLEVSNGRNIAINFRCSVVIPAMDKILSTLGIPGEIASDNGPLYNSEEFKSYAR